MDVGKFLRVQGTIESALASVSDDQAVMAGQSMVEMYERLVIEARAVVPEEDQEQFDRVFPKRIQGQHASNPRRRAELFNEARGLLGSLAGYLGSYVREAKLKMEADAYARERVKAERGVGFKPPKR